MTKDEIIEMVVQIGGCDRPKYDSPALKIFETFATQVAEAEREACAKVCEETDDGTPYNLAEECAAAIRARGQA
jgi:hypothetical protein